MSQFLSSIYFAIIITLYEPLGAVIFSIPTKKRTHCVLNGILAVLLYYIVSWLMSFFHLTWVLQFLGKYILLTLIVMSITQSSLMDGIYCALWTNTSHMLLFYIINIIQILTGYNFFITKGLYIRGSSIYILGNVLFYFVFAKKLCVGGSYSINYKQLILAIFTVLPFNVFNKVLFSDGFSTLDSPVVVYCCFFSCLCSLFVLYMQRTTALNAQLHQENHLMEQLLQQRKMQYELSRENIDIINRKCHDLKHQINLLKDLPSSDIRETYILEVSDSINIYDSVFHTGNEVLDTLLTEKNFYCSSHDITIKCIADGDCLSFIDPVDLYALMGNAIDNAIESVQNIPDTSLRMINLYVRREENFVVICVENYVQGNPEFKDGLPLTTKSDKHLHGFGLKSMKHTAEKYNGSMTLHIENDMFIVRILFPTEL